VCAAGSTQLADLANVVSATWLSVDEILTDDGVVQCEFLFPALVDEMVEREVSVSLGGKPERFEQLIRR